MSVLYVVKMLFKMAVAEKRLTTVFHRDFVSSHITQQSNDLSSVMKPDIPASNDSKVAKGWIWLSRSWRIFKQLMLAFLVLGVLYINMLLLLLIGG